MIKLVVICLTTILLGISSHEEPQSFLHFCCYGNEKIFYYVKPQSNDTKFSCFLNINELLEKGTTVNVTLHGTVTEVDSSRPWGQRPFILSKREDANKSPGDTLGNVTNSLNIFSQLSFLDSESLFFRLAKAESQLTIPLDFPNGALPEIQTLTINGTERCINPASVGQSSINQTLPKEFSDEIDKLIATAVTTYLEHEVCGEQKLEQVETGKKGVKTKPGEWPWHVAISRAYKLRNKYICGGTLVSRTVILTAAHCIYKSGVIINPTTVTVHLGKFKLDGGDEPSQKKKVQTIISHPDYDPDENTADIAILKLVSQVKYEENVQPACLWQHNNLEKKPSESVGTVVGWGIQQKRPVSKEIKKAVLTKITNEECISSDENFSEKLDENKFCAGLKTGASACNGDSGGGFYVFVTDANNNTTKEPSGSWYISGIASEYMPSEENEEVCDPENYLIFTDITKFSDWIYENLKA